MPRALFSRPCSPLPFLTRITATQPSLVSPDGVYIATLHTKHINVYTVQLFDLISSFEVPTQRFKFINLRWEPASTATENGIGVSSDGHGHEANSDVVISRLLLTTTEAVYVFDILNPTVRATVNNGSGGLGTISHADFGRDGDEIMIWTNMGASVTVWDITTGRMTAELKDPKFFVSGPAAAKGSGWSGSDLTGRRVFALLTREGAQDVITLYSGYDYQVVKRWIPPTIDAQGIKWSPNGKWLAVWDAAAKGYKVLIYRADGNLFRTYHGDYYEDELRGLGVKKVEWAPQGSWLAVSGYEKGVTLLSTRTVRSYFPFLPFTEDTTDTSRQFSPGLQLSHPSTITPSPNLTIYQEHATSTSQRNYTRLTTPTSPPTATSSSANNTTPPSTETTMKPVPIGASLLAFSPSATYLATRDDNMPTTVFIWNLATSSLAAVLIQHSIVKSLSWSPSASTFTQSDDTPAPEPTQAQSTLLLITTEGAGAHVYLYDATSGTPRVLSLLQQEEHGEARLGARMEAAWVPKGADREIMVGGTTGCVVVYPEGKGSGGGYVVSSSSSASGGGNGHAVAAAGRESEHGGGEEEEVDEESVFEIAGGDDTFAHKRVEV